MNNFDPTPNPFAPLPSDPTPPAPPAHDQARDLEVDDPEQGATVVYHAAASRAPIPAKGEEGKPGYEPPVPERDPVVWPATVTGVHPVDHGRATLDLTVHARTGDMRVENVEYSDDPDVERSWSFE